MTTHRYAVQSSKFGNIGCVWNTRKMTCEVIIARAVQMAERNARDPREKGNLITVHRQFKDFDGAWKTDFLTAVHTIQA